MSALPRGDREDVVKEESHFFFQKSTRVDHAVQPLSDVSRDAFSTVIPLYIGHVYRRKSLRRNQVIDDLP